MIMDKLAVVLMKTPSSRAFCRASATCWRSPAGRTTILPWQVRVKSNANLTVWMHTRGHGNERGVFFFHKRKWEKIHFLNLFPFLWHECTNVQHFQHFLNKIKKTCSNLVKSKNKNREKQQQRIKNIVPPHLHQPRMLIYSGLDALTHHTWHLKNVRWSGTIHNRDKLCTVHNILTAIRRSIFKTLGMNAPSDASPLQRDFLPHGFHKSVFSSQQADVTAREPAPSASKFTCFAQFYANTRALESSISASSERDKEGERVSEIRALAPDP